MEEPRRLKGGGRAPGEAEPERPPRFRYLRRFVMRSVAVLLGLSVVGLAGFGGYVAVREFGLPSLPVAPKAPESVPEAAKPPEIPPEPLAPLPSVPVAPLTELPGTVAPWRGETRGPVLVERVEPDYPRLARQARMAGTVVLEATIGADGEITDVEVVRGNPILARAAVEAVEEWRYEPALENGLPVAAVVTVTVNFTL